MSLTLTCHADTSVPVEIEGLTPDWACDKSLAEIERFEIYHGNRRIPLAEMFTVAGDPGDRCFDFHGNLSGIHWIGAHLKNGTVRIHGSAGRHVGSAMSGGEIHVEGNTDGWAGAEMRGGRLNIQGNTGHLLGAAYRGSAKGMTGGTIIVSGNAGNEVGHTLRRGVIAVGGSVGDLAAFNMIAGTLLVFGSSGIRPAAGMRRGTVGLFGDQQPALLPTFRYSATFRPQFLRVMLRALQNRGLRFDETLVDAEFDMFHGDLVSVGRGEILKRHTVA